MVYSRGHGKIGFYDLARTISANWKKITIEQKAECLRIVALDRERFEKEMEEFKATKAWLESIGALETAQASSTMTTPSAPKMSSQLSVVSVDSEDLKCREIQHELSSQMVPIKANATPLESIWEPLPVTTMNQDILACTADINIEPNINIDWDTPSTIAELSQRLDKDSQDILIRALL